MTLGKQEERLRKVVSIADRRYTPELNVRLPLVGVFDGLTRADPFLDGMHQERGSLRRDCYQALTAQAQEVLGTHAKQLERGVGQVDRLLKPLINNRYADIDFARLSRRTEHLADLAMECAHLLGKAPEPGNEAVSSRAERPYVNERHFLYRIRQALDQLSVILKGPAARAAVKPRVLLTGVAGSGKTHLLCDVATHRLAHSRPTLVFLAEELAHVDPVRAMMRVLRYRGSRAWFLSQLNKIGLQSKSRVLIAVDAVNEARLDINWNELLSLDAYPGIGVAISVRSGFESGLLTRSDIRKCVVVEHEGFGDQSWEAVRVFFRAYDISLPDVPLLIPDFQNPLFLKIFCETYQGSTSAARGHQGATRLFERYVKRQARQVLRSLGISDPKIRGKHIVWDLIVKNGIAAELAQKTTTGQVSVERARAIVEGVLPGRAQETLRLLERHWILTKLPRWTKGKRTRGYDYRFPYQRFSDHLIVRYLLEQYPIDKADPSGSFLPGTPLGEVLRGREYGLIEALAIQVPERLHGVDLVDVAPATFRTTHRAQQAFMQSLVWRSVDREPDGTPKCFRKDTALKYINDVVIKTGSGHDKVLEMFLTIAVIPGHPFNAWLLDNHLRRFSLGKRDAWWLPFLHSRAADDNPVTRLISWAWDWSNLGKLSDEVVELAGTTLAWFLASSNRFVRDRSTKALVALLSSRPTVLLKLLQRFHDVNDPYIAERLHAVTYGCVLRSPEVTQFGVVGQWIYDTLFARRSPPVHILLRDYARGSVETLLHRGVSLRVRRPYVKPPYQSIFPQKVISPARFKKLYDDETSRHQYSSIWSSLMSMGDFARYIIGTDGRFSWWPIRLSEPRHLTARRKYEQFLEGLAPTQKRLWRRFERSRVRQFRIVFRGSGTPEGLEDDHADRNTDREHEFVESLDDGQRQNYDLVVVPYVTRRTDKEPRFDLERAQRWLFHRVIQLGWRSDIHGDFDRMCQHNAADRTAHKAERIGKKYQWIAYHEFLSRVADNFQMAESDWGRPVQRYEGPWQIDRRDIDPSFLVRSKPQAEATRVFWWRPARYEAWKRDCSDIEWLRDRSDLSRPASHVLATDSKGTQWVVLDAYEVWKEPHPADEEEFELPRREVWLRLQSFLVRRRDARHLRQWARGQNFFGNWLPDAPQLHGVFLWEYPWARAYRFVTGPFHDRQRWRRIDRRGRRIPFSIHLTTDDYEASDKEYDCSVEEGLGVSLPSEWLISAMGLRPAADGAYCGRDGTVVAYDPSIADGGRSCVLVRREALETLLCDHDLEMVWLGLGEKQMMGGRDHHQIFLGRLDFNVVVHLDRRGMPRASVSYADIQGNG